MKEFSLIMALVDYIPVILFILAMFILINNLRNKIDIINKIILYFGITLVSLAGFFKATYKLLYSLNIGDYIWMSNQFFTNQALGFLLVGIGILMFISKKNKKINSFIPTMGLVFIMIVGLAAMDAGLCYIANKMKKRNALICFIISFFLCLMMGYLSSRNFDKALINWIAQGINILGQLLLFIGIKILDQANLKEYI